MVLKKMRSSILIALSFVGIILLGTLLLMLPVSSNLGEATSFTDSLFTATSATCVTGLITLNTPEHWSTFGQIVILIMIQIGGLGTMTIFSLFYLILRKKISLKQRLNIKESFGMETNTGLVKFVKNVIKYAFITEFIGAILLSFYFIPELGILKGFYFSIFHSISAFCNAGFDLTGDSLVGLKYNLLVNLTVAILIIAGGIGFIVFFEIYEKKRFKFFSLHTKLVLIMTVILLLSGTLLFFLLEYTNVDTIKDSNLWQKFLISFFQSTSARTAGFNTIDLSKIHDSSAFLLIILMFIGASPASTGGGIKTTTFGLILFSTISMLRGDNQIKVFKKGIKQEAMYKAFVISFLGIAIVIMSAFIISIVESDSYKFLDILFECVSAFGTVGTSRGITSDLHILSKYVIIIVMMLGRIGSFSIANGILERKKESHIKYSYGRIFLG